MSDITPAVAVQSGQAAVPAVDPSYAAPRSEVAPPDADTTQRSLGAGALQVAVETGSTAHEFNSHELDAIMSGRGVLTDVKV